MKFINIAFTLLFTAANGASISQEFDSQVEESFLRKSNRNVPGTPEEWLDALNEARETGQVAIGGEYVPLEWSADLALKASKWANRLATKCENGVPSGQENPGDFGVNTVLNMRNPKLAVERWMINGEHVKCSVLVKLTTSRSPFFTVIVKFKD